MILALRILHHSRPVQLGLHVEQILLPSFNAQALWLKR